jgi:hypothetical protein
VQDGRRCSPLSFSVVVFLRLHFLWACILLAGDGTPGGIGSSSTGSHVGLSELGRYLDCAGATDAAKMIYITTEPLDGLPILLLLFTLAFSSKLQYDVTLGTLSRSKGFSSSVC